MKRSIPGLACLLVALVTFAAPALAETGFQFAAPNTRAPDDPAVNGFRLSVLHGENTKQAGVDFGLISFSETTTFSGAAFIMGMGKVKGDMQGGAAFSLVNVHEGTDSGLNAAFINLVNKPTNAVDIGFVQIAKGTTMLDIGGLNVSNKSHAQLGFINVTKQITGFQFGFVNAAENGFLPVFPIVNFPGK